MDQLKLKIELISECRKLQQKVVDNLRAEMAESQQSANDYGAPKDRYDSFRMQLLRKKDMYGQQLEKALAELYALDKIDIKKLLNKACFGAVVITKEQKFFISIGLGKLNLEEESYFAVSVKVPVSQAMMGRQKGETVEVNGRKIEIVEVF
jgi:transcription elongation GreA/GreB family factor